MSSLPRIGILSSLKAGDLGRSYERAFRELGCQVQLLDPWKLFGWAWKNRVVRRVLEKQLLGSMNRELLPQLASLEVDVLWIGKGQFALPQLWAKLKQLRPDMQLVVYNADNPVTTFSRGQNRPWVTESIPCFDMFCTYNSNLIQDLVTHRAQHPVWIPFGWDPQVHPSQYTADTDKDVIFIGNGDEHRYQWLRKIFSHSGARKWNAKVYGYWPAKYHSGLQPWLENSQVMGQSMAGLVGSAKVALNILRIQNEGSHNMRTFEIPGSGGLLASQYSKEQAQFFPSGEAAIYFETADEAVDKINQVLSDPVLESSMKENAREIVSHNRYVDRAQATLQQLTALQGRQQEAKNSE